MRIGLPTVADASPSRSFAGALMVLCASAVVGCTRPHAVSVTAEEAPLTITWEWGPVLPHVKSAFSTVAADDVAVTVGGTWWETDTAGQMIKQWLSTVYQLRPQDHQWSQLPAYSSPIAYALTVAVDKHLYVIGGSTAVGDASYDVRVLDFAAASPTWRAGPSLPQPAARIRGGAIGSVIVAAIENGSSGHEDVSGVWCLDTQRSDRGWQKLSDLPDPGLSYRAGTVCGDALYLFGGGTPTSVGGIELHDNADAFSPRTQQWRSVKPLPIPMRDMTAAPLDGRYILITGGVEQAVAETHAPDHNARILLSHRCWLYDTCADAYHPLTALPLAVADHGMAVIGDTVYIVGGEDSIHRSRTDLLQVGHFGPR